jgi:hypothetical protein
MNLSFQYGEFRAVNKKFYIVANENNGLTITFETLSGMPVLNGISVQKLL